MSDDLVTPLVGMPWVSEAALVENMRFAQLCHGREYARDLEAVAGLAAQRRSDRPLGTVDGRGGPGVDAVSLTDEVLAGVREDFITELAVTRGCSEEQARTILREALLLTGPLTSTWSHLFAGRLTVAHAKAVVDLLGDATPEVATEVQARVLAKSDGLTTAAFRDRLRYQLYRLDAEAKERRRREALKKVGVFVRRFDEGVSELVLQGPTPWVHAAYDSIDGHARMVRADGDPRPLGVLRAETGLDLLLRPWDTGRPPVTAHLVLHAPIRSLRGDSEDPGELDGTVISAAECRELIRDLDGLDSALIALDDAATGVTLAVATRKELAQAAGGPGLAPPPDTDAYEPTAAQKRFLSVRDRHCRMPGCRRRPGRARTDLDHDDPHTEGGPTACWNLCCLCQRHHRIKTFAPGWFFQLLRDGTYVVRTPAGVVRHTRPPGWFPHPEPDPPWLDELAPPDPLRC